MVDLEQFREAVEFMQMRGTREQCIRAGDMLQVIIDNAGGVECAEPVAWQRRYAHQLPAGGLCAWREITRDEYEAAVSAEYPDRTYEYRVLYTAPQQPAPVVDDAMVERALNAARDASDARLPRYSVVRAILTAALSSVQGVESP